MATVSLGLACLLEDISLVSLITVLLLFSVLPRMFHGYYPWMPKGFAQVRGLTVLCVVSSVHNTDVK